MFRSDEAFVTVLGKKTEECYILWTQDEKIYKKKKFPVPPRDVNRDHMKPTEPENYSQLRFQLFKLIKSGNTYFSEIIYQR